MANVSSSNGLEKRPKLRFPGFDEPWKAALLSDYFAKNIKKNADGAITNVICNSAKQGLIPQRDYFDKDIANSDNTDGYYIIETNDFVYNPRKSTDAPCGPISSYKYPEAGIVSPLYLCFRAKQEINPLYFEWYFRSSAWHRYIYMSGDSGARHDRVSIKDDTFFAMPINIPSAKEQDRIALFLNAIEQKIDKQRSLVDALKKYKRGLLSAIFERRIRFKDDDGSKFPEWEQKKLISCCNGFDNLRQPITANLRRKGKYPYYGANGIQDYVDDYIFDGEYILLAEDGGHFDEFASKPIAQFISGRVWVNNHAHIIQAKQGYNNKYIFYCLEHKDIRKYINGSSRAKLNQEDMWDIPIPVPCLYEQEKIADFITAIDCSINDNVRQLETLQDLKTSLLQQLFI